MRKIDLIGMLLFIFLSSCSDISGTSGASDCVCPDHEDNTNSCDAQMSSDVSNTSSSSVADSSQNSFSSSIRDDDGLGSSSSLLDEDGLGGTFSDSRDSKEYSYVKIGNQIWMAENLNYDSGNTSVCYDSASANCDFYGRLYSWDGAMNGAPSTNSSPSAVRGICPDNWHLPSDAEWEELAEYASQKSGLESIGYNYGSLERDDWSDLGIVFKSTSDWDENAGTDDFGFRALPAGGMNLTPIFHGEGTQAFWWSATEYDSQNAWNRYLDSDNHVFDRNSFLKGTYRSIRCVADSPTSWSLSELPEPEEIQSFSTDTITDPRDGKSYGTVNIFGQNWFSENLAFVPSSGSACLDGSDAMCENYGRLYEWSVVINPDGSGSDICPNGWHVPTTAEWKVLADNVSDLVVQSQYTGNTWTEIGRLMKATSWSGTDAVGFNALPSGLIGKTGGYLHNVAYWWASAETETSSESVSIIETFYLGNGEDLFKSKIISGSAMRSIRCIENE